MGFNLFDRLAMSGRIIAVGPSPKPSWYEDEGPYAMLAGAVVAYEHVENVRETEQRPTGANMALRRNAFEKYRFFGLLWAGWGTL
jgi:hypothetical protein